MVEVPTKALEDDPTWMVVYFLIGIASFLFISWIMIVIIRLKSHRLVEHIIHKSNRITMAK